MSVGFRDVPPEPPAEEHLLWRVSKGERIAEARVRMYPHGRELRITVAAVVKT